MLGAMAALWGASYLFIKIAVDDGMSAGTIVCARTRLAAIAPAAGGLMILLASLGYAIGAFMVKARFKPINPIGLVTLTMGISALLTLPVALATAPDHFPSAGATASLVVLGVGGSGVAFVLFYTLI